MSKLDYCIRCGTHWIGNVRVCNACLTRDAIEQQTRQQAEIAQRNTFVPPAPITSTKASESRILPDVLWALGNIVYGYIVLCLFWWFVKLPFVIFYNIWFGWQGWPTWVWIGF